MDVAAYAVEAEVEQTHWWFVGRRRLLARELQAAGARNSDRLLDVGTSTGSNLRMLRDLGFENFVGLDASEEAIRFCAAKGFEQVRKGDIRAMPFPDESFDFVMATDVIEHVDEDRLAAREIARVLKPGGRALITVPAFAALWGLQDRQAFHKRRYLMASLSDVLESAGFRLERRYYFNYLLFVPIWVARRLIDGLGLTLRSEGEVNTPWLNALLSKVFALDVATAPLLRPPFGVSIFALVSKPARA